MRRLIFLSGVNTPPCRAAIVMPISCSRTFRLSARTVTLTSTVEKTEPSVNSVKTQMGGRSQFKTSTDIRIDFL
jgi:hypothetical protein